jgi:hypothetical protein
MIIVRQERMQGHDIALIQNIEEMSLISEIIFQQKIFVQKSTFSSRFKKQVIAFAQNLERRRKDRGELLIIDCGVYITLWIEKIAANAIDYSKFTSNINSVDRASESKTSISATNPENNLSESEKSDERYIKKVYRGIPYWEKLEKLPENSQKSDNSKEKRKYRGNYY